MTDSLQPLRRTLAALLLATLAPLAQALDYQVVLDTTPLIGRAGYIAFDLLGGAPGTSNQATLSAFTSTSTLGLASVTGDVVGNLPAAVTLASTSFFNEYLQAVTFAAGLTTFTLSVSNQHVLGDLPDQFALFLLDPTLAPFATSDPTGAGAMLVIDLLAQPTPQLYSSVWATVSLVPEPAPLSMALAGVLVLLLVGARVRGQRPAV